MAGFPIDCNAKVKNEIKKGDDLVFLRVVVEWISGVKEVYIHGTLATKMP